MKTQSLVWKGMLFLMAIPILFIQCEKEGKTDLQSFVQLEITDAPIDDEQVQGVFLTLAEVRINGQAFAGFEGKKTFDLLALQNGLTDILGSGEITGQQINEISLLLDHETDANGRSPGCYVLTKSGTRLFLNGNPEGEDQPVCMPAMSLDGGTTNRLVLDLDLRKLIRYSNGSDASAGYALSSHTEAGGALRLTNRANSGTISGTLSDGISFSEKVIVFAYQDGTFERESELTPSGEGRLRFRNAVTSAVVDEQGHFQLSFLEPAQYELVFASYQDNDLDGSMDLTGTLEVSALSGLDPRAVTLSAGNSLDLQLSVIGIGP